MNKNKVQWRRVNSGLECFVYELNERGIGFWKLYTSSKLYVPDSLEQGYSRGLNTFRECLKHKYILLDVNGKEVTY